MPFTWSKKAIEDATEVYRSGVGLGMSVRIEKALIAASSAQQMDSDKSERIAELEMVVKLIAELPLSTEPAPADVLFKSTILSLKYLAQTIAKRDASILVARKILER